MPQTKMGFTRARRRDDVVPHLRERGDQRVDETLLALPVVARGPGPGARPTGAVRRLVGIESLFVCAARIEQPAERKSQARAVGRARLRALDRGSQARDQGIFRRGDGGESRQPRKRQVAARIDFEDPLVARACLLAPSEILVEIGEVEQRRDVARIQLERRDELGRGSGVAAEIVGVDHAPVEMHFLGLRDTAIQRLLIGSQRRLVAPRLALQQRKVVPGVGPVRPARKQPLVCRDRFGKPPSALQQDCVAQQRVCVGSHGHTIAMLSLSRDWQRLPRLRAARSPASDRKCA